MPISNEGLPNQNHEILLRVEKTMARLEGKFDAHTTSYAADQIRVHQELGQRPKRAEILSWLGGAGVLSGIIFSLLQFVG